MKVQIGPRDKFPIMSEINMIPLIDVSLVLLIIFMVVTPFLVSSQIKVSLPKAVSGVPPESEPIKIQISARKNFYLNQQSVHLDDLASALRAKFAETKNSTVVVESDATVPVELVIKAMDVAKSAGAQKLGVAVSSEQPEAEKEKIPAP
ncbi:MAG: biopolymer transporter ExbD [Elusimicrobia bacterium]|nr:biopolymer transporter ExbD [Elusimicrobiota bacterium]MBI3013189.1 biopolymer transporter ExbD [Elusimicrobiota bacterium]MBI4217574.1 biopolymer transporter ExbD [Elusimicrobiota bacterium]